MSEELPQGVDIGGNKFTFPWIDLVPRNTSETLEAIKESVKQNGILSPILLFGDTEVIDGHTRLLIAKELGLKIHTIPFAVFQGSREAAENAAVATNAARRDWTREVRLATVKALFKKDWSQRRIAQALGVGPSQVNYDLKHLGLIEAPPPAPKQAPIMPTGSTADSAAVLSAPDGVATPVAEEPVADTPVVVEQPPAPAIQSAPYTVPATQAAAPSAPKPEPSVADRRQANIVRGKELVRSLVKVFSELSAFKHAEDPLDELMSLLDEVDKGKK